MTSMGLAHPLTAGATPTVVATVDDDAVTVEAEEGTVVELRPVDGIPDPPLGGTVGTSGELTIGDVDPGLYEVWAHESTSSTFGYAGHVVVRDDQDHQDLLAQSEPVEGDQLHRFGYVEVGTGPTRTLLSFDLRLPAGLGTELPGPVGACTADCGDPEVPTLFEYSPYDGSDPGLGSQGNESKDEVDRGYGALVVNVRGTGCSGSVMGATPINHQQALDGRDVIAALSSQAWSTGNVGMVGSSVPGILQLNVAAEDPPGLVAITPGAVTGRAYDDGYAVGIPTRHFDFWSTQIALQNAPSSLEDEDRVDTIVEAFGYPWEPFSSDPEDPGHPNLDQNDGSWVYRRSTPDPSDPYGPGDTVDPICQSNAEEHAANPLIRDLVDQHPAYTSALWASGALDFRAMLAATHVPTLLIEGLQDEFAPRGFDHLFDAGDPEGSDPAAVPGTSTTSSGSSFVRVVTGSGGHSLAQSPEAKTERDAFLDLLVAERTIPLSASAPGHRLRPSGDDLICRPAYLDDPAVADADRDEHDEQVGLLEQADPIVVYWEQAWEQNGAIARAHDDPPLYVGREVDEAGNYCHGARFVSEADSWPLLGTTHELVFGADGSLHDEEDEEEPATGTVYFQAEARNTTWEALGPPHASLPAGGQAAEFTSEPLEETSAYAGPASVDVMLRSDQPVVDLEVTISEVGEDGSETLVRSGWRRTSLPDHPGTPEPLQPRPDTRAVDACGEVTPSTCLAPIFEAPTPTPVRIPISSFAHIFHKGSQIRVRVSGPGYSALALPMLTQPAGTGRPNALGGAGVEVVIDQPGDGRLVLSRAAGIEAIEDDPGMDVPSICGTLSNLDCFAPQVWATAQHPYEDGEAILHVDWDTDHISSTVDGYHIYLDDDPTPVATVPAAMHPGIFGSVDVTIDSNDEPQKVSVAPYVDEGTSERVLPAAWTDQIDVPSSDGTPGAQLLHPVTATAEGPGVTMPRIIAFDHGSVELVAGGHGSSDRAVRYTQDPGAELPLALLGAELSDMKEVDPGHPYHVEGWFKGGPDATRVGLAIMWWDRLGHSHLSVEPIELDADQGWTFASLTANPPPGAEITASTLVMLDPTIDANDVSRSVIIDDLAFCKGRTSCV